MGLRTLIAGSITLLAFQAAGADRACRLTGATLPEGSLSLRLDFNVGWEHGCSQSMESFGELGELALEVDADGKARLRLNLFHANTFGPSLGAYKQGQRDFSHNDSRYRARWKGTARREGGRLIVRFTERASTTELWGSDFKPQRTDPSDLVLTCKPAALLLDPPLRTSKTDQPEPPRECAPVVLCRPSAPLLSFHHEIVRELSAGLYYDGHLPLAPDPGLEADIERQYFSDWDTLRRKTK